MTDIRTSVDVDEREPFDPPMRVSVKSRSRRTVFVVVATISGVIFVLGLLNLPYVRAAFAFLGGERLIVMKATGSFGEGRVGELRELVFPVWNLTGEPVRVVGANSHCTCVATKDLPLEIPPGARGDLVLHITLSKKISEKVQRVFFFTESKEKPQFAVSFSGRVLD